MYFLYRINSDYDGFLPCHIPGRAYRQCISYNWRTYFENLEPGDIALTYFAGPGCRKGIFAVTKILSIKIGVRESNVVGRLLSFSPDNHQPLIDAKENASLFSNLHSRCRGAEIIIPDRLDGVIYHLLTECGAIAAVSGPKGIPMPGSTADRTHSLRDVPPINCDHLSNSLRKKGVLAAYWIRPTQATWMAHAPEWLQRITQIFHKFKAGDLSRLEVLALALAKRVIIQVKTRERIGVLLSVPLNAQKQQNGEVDRVSALAKRVSATFGVPYSRSLSLEGRVSRRLYKKSRLPDLQFQKRYRQNLRIRHTRYLVNCVESGREILLIDDVYTDGVTTETIVDSLRREFGDRVRVKVVTLGIMAKARNMNEDLSAAWR